MSLSAANILTIAGAVAELFGLWLVVRDLRDTGRDAAEVQRRTTRLYAEWSSAFSTTAGTLTVSGGREPTLEQRVAALETGSAALQEDMRERFATLSKGVARHTARVSGEARSHADDLDRELRGWLSAQLGGKLGRKWRGVGWFAIGVVLSAAGNLVG